MKAAEAALLIPCDRPGLPGPDEPRIAKAVRAARKDPALQEALARQRSLDERCLEALERIAMPPSMLARIGAIVPTAPRLGGKNALRQPVILAVIMGALVMLGWGGYTLWNRQHSFAGKDDVMRMVEANDDMNPNSMEAKSGKVSALDDWFFSKYGFEDFFVPAGFGDYKAVLARLFKQDGMPVAQVAVEENGMIFYSFKAEDFGVEIRPNDSWRIFDDGDWVAAVEQHDDECFMVAFHGSKSDMETFLAGKKQ